MSNETVTRTVKAEAGKYLTFSLANEEYGLEILKVQEIIGLMDITRVPKVPAYIRGVINLRGKVIPVVDLRRKFELETQDDTERTCIIVVQCHRNDMLMTMGIIVDQVSEVLDIKQDQLEAPPALGNQVDTDFIMGMGKVAKKVVMLLDIEKVLAAGEMQTVAELAKSE